MTCKSFHVLEAKIKATINFNLTGLDGEKGFFIFEESHRSKW